MYQIRVVHTHVGPCFYNHALSCKKFYLHSPVKRSTSHLTCPWKRYILCVCPIFSVTFPTIYIPNLGMYIVEPFTVFWLESALSVGSAQSYEVPPIVLFIVLHFVWIMCATKRRGPLDDGKVDLSDLKKNHHKVSGGLRQNVQIDGNS